MNDEIIIRLNAIKSYFNTQKTKDVSFRILQLQKLKRAIINNEKKIIEALYQDLHKSHEEAYLTEIGLVLKEIDYHIKNLPKWAALQHVSTPIYMWPSRSKIKAEPLGVALIISPWNYPFQLTISPLIGAISAGCCAVLKPSPDSAHTAKVLEDIIQETFAPEYIKLVRGGIEVNQLLLQQRFDIIFFTGSTRVGKIVQKAAAENLTPVVLELGGKSPCIVDKSANLALAAKRIVWGKTLNAGQTCIAPDYVYVHQDVKAQLLDEIKKCVQTMFGSDQKKNNFYGRIIHPSAFNRLKGLMQNGKIVHGGATDESEKYIELTVIDSVQKTDPIMQEEIFGPLLPTLSFANIDEVITHLNNSEKPLALYYFGDDKNANEFIQKTSSGGVCINDTIMHVSNHNLPFGGVGYSGQGAYHGKRSFDVFSHHKAIVYTPTWIDLPFKYAPFKYFKFVKKMI
ncbi:MAG: aldehyde dehydrogenase [Bacteroidia bacterium]|nr:aldehyde dehydrogenase [Bacteroidia bacterium]